MKRIMQTTSRREFLRIAGSTLVFGASIKENFLPKTRLFLNGLIIKAGNASSEKTRYKLLSEVIENPELPQNLKKELKNILPVIYDWAYGREKAFKNLKKTDEHRYLSNFFYHDAKIENEFPPKPADDSPLYPIWALYRGRMLIWRLIQYGFLQQNEKDRNAYIEEGQRLLREAGRVFPENKVIGMYLGQPTNWPFEVKQDPRAPEWANRIRENIEKIAHITRWWAEYRQLPNGEYGGGWGDDVEMWRWQVPVLIGFQDKQLINAQEKLSQGIFDLPVMKGGFLNDISDVEHTAENTADSITPMMHLQPQEPKWENRALKLADLMENIWTGRNERGFLQFKSAYFNVNRIDTSSPRGNCDTVYHLRTMQPTLLYWQRTGDARLTELFTSWMDTWVDATQREERGKPAGIIPSAIHWPDGKVGGVGDNWWAPEIQPDNSYYAWPSKMVYLTNTLLLTYYMTGNEKYLGPIRSMAKIQREFSKNKGENVYEPGSKGWCAQQMDGFLPDTLGKYRLLTGDTQFDHLLSGNPYVSYRFRNEKGTFNRLLSQSTKALRQNYEGFTSECRWTDRVISFTSNYLQHFMDKSLPTVESDLLYSAVTGDPGGSGYFPMNAVRWITEPRDLGVLVNNADTNILEAELYHFGEAQRHMEAELFLLARGDYFLELKTRTGKVLNKENFEVKNGAFRITFELPARQLCDLKIYKG